jgi:hypothetical protein
MSPSNRQALEYLEVRGYYTTTYTQLVRPERIFAVTDYFRRYWVPLLKPGPAWLVVALRQRCFWNGQRDWCVVSRQTLAQESGVAVRTADNYLSAPLVDRFVTGRRPRYSRTRDGAKRRDWTHYDVRLDEPLTPAHQAALAALAAELTAVCQATDPAERTLQIAERILEIPSEELLGRLDQTTKDMASRSEAEWTKETKGVGCLLTVLEIVESVANPGSEIRPLQGIYVSPESAIEPSAALVRACDAIYTRIVRPDKVQIATQYFRLSWLPLLGAARAWLILHLRSRCYLSTHELEVRDTCSVAGLAEMSAALGVSISTVKTCLAEPPAAEFLTHLATHRPAAGQVTMSFRVEMIDPLTPDDLQRQAEMVTEPVVPLDAEVASLADSQQPDFAASPSEQQPDFAGSPLDQQPESAGSPPGQKTESAAILDEQPDYAASLPDQETDFAGIGSTANSQNLHSTKTLIITSDFLSTHQQQLLIPAGYDAQPLAVAAGSLPFILDGLKIQEPVRSRILALNPPATTVLAWALEALLSERLENRIGFLVSMLLAGYVPPPDLEQLVRLPVSVWMVLAQAAQDTRATGRAELAPHLASHFEAFYTRFGRLDPARWPILLPTPAAASYAGGEQGAPGEEPSTSSGDPGKHESKIGNQEVAWACVLDDLHTQMDPSTFNTWLRGSQVIRVEGNRWTVAVRSQTAAGWLQHRLLPVIERALRRVAGKPIEVEFEVES